MNQTSRPCWLKNSPLRKNPRIVSTREVQAESVVGKETRNSDSSTGIAPRYRQVGKCLGAIARPSHRATLKEQSERQEGWSLPLRQKRIPQSRILAGAKTGLIHSCVSKLSGLTHVRGCGGSDD